MEIQVVLSFSNNSNIDIVVCQRLIRYHGREAQDTRGAGSSFSHSRIYLQYILLYQGLRLNITE